MDKLVALDLDGTLTQHKSPLETECFEILRILAKGYKLLMICAGGCERVYRQMGEFPIEIIGFYGMQNSGVIDGKFAIIETVTVPVNRTKVLRKVKKLREEFNLTEYDGDSVEFHQSGLLTFPILGTGAPLDKKLAYDPDRTKRRQYYTRVCEMFGGYNVFIGGSSSFDIVPKPYCKLYALEQYLANNNIARSAAIFFGDDYGLGGNDSDIYNSDIRFVKVDNYREFPQIARQVLK